MFLTQVTCTLGSVGGSVYHSQQESRLIKNPSSHLLLESLKSCCCLPKYVSLFLCVFVLSEFCSLSYYELNNYGSDGKASVYNAGDLGSIPGLGRSPGEGNANALQDYCLENPMDRGAWGLQRVRHD